jgi:hypothetical protein
LKNGKSQRAGADLHRGLPQVHPPSRGTIRLADDSDDFCDLG